MRNNLSRITKLFSRAKYRVLIVSAFVSSSTLDKLLSSSVAAKSRSVYARWRIDDLATGASDWKAWDVAHKHNVPLYACSNLHAKLYVADETVILGSANATKAGLSENVAGNLELLIQSSCSVREISEVIELVQSNSEQARPVGSDVLTQIVPGGDDTDELASGVFLPKSDPRTFLDVISGKCLHTKETTEDFTALKLRQRAYNHREIVACLRSMTVFRIVRYEFENRLHPMPLEELHSKVAPYFPSLSARNTTILAHWLGVFGDNTHLSPSQGDAPVTLNPGKLMILE